MKKPTRFILILVLGLIIFPKTILHAQVKIGDNPTTINPYSLLELESTNKAFLFPRMTSEQRDAAFNLIDAPVGLAIFNTTSNQLEVLHTKFSTTGKVETEWTSTTNSKIGTGTTPPASPQNGEMFFDTASNQFMVFDGGQWHNMQTFTPGASEEEYQMLTLTDAGELKLGTASIDLKAWLEEQGAFRTDSDKQKLTLTGNQLNLENGGTVDLSKLALPSVNQLLQLGNTTSQTSALNLTNGGSVSLQASGSLQFGTQNNSLVFEVPQAMAQDLSIDNVTSSAASLTISGGGNAISLQASGVLSLSRINSNTLELAVIPTNPVSSIKQENANYTASVDDGVILVAPAAAITITVPAPATEDNGKTLTIKRTNAFSSGASLQVVGSGTTFDGTSSLNLNVGFQGYSLQAFNGNWHIVERF